MELINSVEVKGLYGFYDYAISCETGDHVKILTGPNGYGKTTLLQMMHHLLGADFWYFYTIPFISFELQFAKGQRLVLDRRLDGVGKDIALYTMTNPLQVTYFEKDKKIESFLLPNDYITILKLRSNWTQLQSQMFTSGLSWEDFLKKYYHTDFDKDVRDLGPNIFMFLQIGHGLLGISRLLQSQVDVLLPNGMPFKRYVASTIDLNNHFKLEDFRSAIAHYNEECQKLDATYIKRLMNMKQDESQDKESQLKRLSELRVRIQAMARYGLMKEDEIIGDIPERYINTVELYIQDTKQKLDFLQPFYEKLNLFDRLINERALAHKHMELSSSGIALTDDNNVDVPLDRLSSGEQHLLILFYHLIFQTKPNSVIFIDEPEMSMHPAWLNQMLNNFKEIARMNNFQIIFATHSVSFIDGQWELSTDLFKQHRGIL